MVKELVGQLAEATGELKVKDGQIKLQSVKPIEAASIPQGDPARPEVGVFASRSPFRPNPIGLQRVELMAIDGNRVRVRGLDALDGTPVLDIKPALRRDR